MLGNKKKYNKRRVVYVVINRSLFIFIPQCDSEGEDDKVNNLFTNLCFTSVIEKSIVKNSSFINSIYFCEKLKK